MKIGDAVAKYIELRDKKAVYKGEYEAKVANIDKNLDILEAKLLEYFDKTGTESFRTEFGTVSASKRNNASIADKEIFRQFIKDNDAWEMVIMRANAPVVAEYKAANDNILPPGLNWSTERVVSVRRKD